MRLKNILMVVAKSLTTTIIFFAVVEVVLRVAYVTRNAMVTEVPLPYVVGDDYGPVPPWLDRLLILRPDDALIWRNVPNVHRTYVDIFSPIWSAEDRVELLRRFRPTLPPAFQANPRWTITLDADGYRNAARARAKPPGLVRIACIGDSWTFGMNVDQDRTYPSRLAERLRQDRPGTEFEVLNFGVLGYSSFQGLELLKRHALDLAPDIVLIGFGMNDSEVAGYRDKDMVTDGRPPRVATRLKDAARGSELYKLLQYVALAARFRPKPIGDYLKAEAEEKGPSVVNYEEIEPWTRVSPRDYDRNIRDMIGRAKARGARVVLLDNELWDGSPYRPVLRQIAQDEGVPLVDSLRIVADARQTFEHDLEVKLALSPASDEPPAASHQAPASNPVNDEPRATTVVFRVFHGSFPVPKTMSIVGTDPRLGALVPNTIAMHDDGTAGDERAGDGVWSYAAAFPAGTPLFYMYTNSGGAGRWEGLDVPGIRRLQVKPRADGGPVYLPIETFGKIYMQSDAWHTDATGYDLIARAVADALRVADGL